MILSFQAALQKVFLIFGIFWVLVSFLLPLLKPDLPSRFAQCQLLGWSLLSKKVYG